MTRRTNADGTVREYLQLAHNERDPDHGWSRTQVLHSFGRVEDVDPMALRRLARSIARYLDDDQLERVAMQEPPQVTAVRTRPAAAAVVVATLWEALELHEVVAQLVRGREAQEQDVGRCLQARVLDHLAAHPRTGDDPARRSTARGFLDEVGQGFEETVWFTVADVLGLRTDRLHVVVDRDGAGQRALAVTDEGVPVRSWHWRHVEDDAVRRTVEADLAGWYVEAASWTWRDNGVVIDGPADDAAAEAVARVDRAVAALRPLLTDAGDDEHRERMLALLLVRAAVLRTGLPWPRLLAQLDDLRDVDVDLGGATTTVRSQTGKNERSALMSLADGRQFSA